MLFYRCNILQNYFMKSKLRSASIFEQDTECFEAPTHRAGCRVLSRQTVSVRGSGQRLFG